MKDIQEIDYLIDGTTKQITDLESKLIVAKIKLENLNHQKKQLLNYLNEDDEN